MGLSLAVMLSTSVAQVDHLYLHRHVEDNLERSLNVLEGLLQATPEDPRLLWRAGRSLARLGERKSTRKERIEIYKRAEEYLKRSVELGPQDAQAHYWLGLAYGRRGEAQGILKSLFLVKPIKEEMKKTIELDPAFGGPHHVLGEMLRQLPGFAGGSSKGAVEEFKKALTLSPNHTAHYPAAAEAFLDAGKREDAVAILKKVFEVKEPDDPGEYQDNLKDAEEMLKKLGEKK